MPPNRAFYWFLWDQFVIWLMYSFVTFLPFLYVCYPERYPLLLIVGAIVFPVVLISVPLLMSINCLGPKSSQAAIWIALGTPPTVILVGFLIGHREESIFVQLREWQATVFYALMIVGHLICSAVVIGARARRRNLRVNPPMLLAAQMAEQPDDGSTE